jgi:DNA-binding transcriptional MerR regulator
MLISEFARAAALTTDTVRFYVRKGLIAPETSSKGGSNPYQVFAQEHVEAARIIKVAQSLGFSLKEIAAFAREYRDGEMGPERSVQILSVQMAKLREKAEQLSGVLDYLQAKVDWLERGGIGPEPRFGEFECGATGKSVEIGARPKPGSVRSRSMRAHA